MKHGRIKKDKVGLILFSLGIIILMIIFTATVWSDFEALNLDRMYLRRPALTNLRCPIFINSVEESNISIKITNRTDIVTRPSLTTLITQSTLSFLNRERTGLKIQPGETQIITRNIYPEDAVFGNMILVKAMLDNPYPTPDKQSVCGVYLVNISFMTGKQISFTLFSFSLLSIIGGMFLYINDHKPLAGKFRQKAIILISIAIGILVFLFISNIGFWLIGFFGYFFVVIALLNLLLGDRVLTIED